MLCCAVVALAPHCHVVLCCGGPGHFMSPKCNPLVALVLVPVLCCAVCCVLHAVVGSLLCEVPPRWCRTRHRVHQREQQHWYPQHGQPQVGFHSNVFFEDDTRQQFQWFHSCVQPVCGCHQKAWQHCKYWRFGTCKYGEHANMGNMHILAQARPRGHWSALSQRCRHGLLLPFILWPTHSAEIMPQEHYKPSFQHEDNGQQFLHLHVNLWDAYTCTNREKKRAILTVTHFLHAWSYMRKGRTCTTHVGLVSDRRPDSTRCQSIRFEQPTHKGCF